VTAFNDAIGELTSQIYGRLPWTRAEASIIGLTGATGKEEEDGAVGQFAKPLTTKATKVHEGNAWDQRPSWYFVSLVVQGFVGCIVKLTQYRGWRSRLCALHRRIRRLRPI